ncbi:MAG: precorrin-8X methylmutase, partial [Ilumatobacteraceae bacterium]
MIDWSANSSPKQGKDSIWVAVADRGGEVVFVHNPRTREEMSSVLREILTDRFERVLVGCDFSFGYPAGLADVIADNPDASWRDVWSWVGAHILDEPNNRNNRFDVAAE